MSSPHLFPLLLGLRHVLLPLQFVVLIASKNGVVFVSSFNVGVLATRDSTSRHSQTLGMSSSGGGGIDTCQGEAVDEETIKHKRIVQANFIATKEVSTSPLNVPPSPNGMTLSDFFEADAHRNLLFSDECTVKEIGPPSERQWALIERQTPSSAKKEGIEEVKCSMLEITNPIKFPGVKLFTISTMASQFLLVEAEEKNIQHPEYRFTLLDTRFRAEGLPPAVWLFNKLTGSKGSGDDGVSTNDDNVEEAEPPTTSSFTRVWPNLTSDGKKIVFNMNARLQTRIRIPRVLMKLLPMNLEKFEQMGSERLQKALDKDIEPGITRFQKAYLEWITT